MPLEWDIRMSTRLPEIDDEHREWIKHFNEFDRAISTGQGVEVIQSTLDFLEKYAEAHFAHEESLAELHKSPVAALNHSNHDQFRAQLQELHAWVRRGGASSVEVVSIKHDMEDWLVNHILKVDTQILPPESN